jgi:RNA polymerase sigma-70 factor (family 1)
LTGLLVSLPKVESSSIQPIWLVLFSIFKQDKNFEELSDAEYQRIFRDYYKSVRNFIWFRCGDQDLAEDIAQDTFVKLWENRNRIDKSTVKAYLYKIAQNNTINYQKRQQLLLKFKKKPGNDREYDHPEKLAEMNEYEEKLQRVIAMLPEGGREVFLMNRIEDMTYQEIADRLGLSVKAIEKRMSKVLKLLREQLGTEI